MHRADQGAGCGAGLGRLGSLVRGFVLHGFVVGCFVIGGCVVSGLLDRFGRFGGLVAVIVAAASCGNE